MTAIAPEFEVIVRGRTAVAERVVRVELERADGEPFPEWRPGAHLDLLLPIGVERQYSLCGDPADCDVWTIGVLREERGRGGSDWVHELLEVGGSIRVRGPWNHFAMTDAASYRFVAGGIGITPLLPMIRAAEASGASWTLDYAGSSTSRMAFASELASLGGERVRLHVADEGRRLDLAALTPRAGELVYACGPARMIDELASFSNSWPPSTLHVERFEAKPLAEPVLHESFEVELLLSGETLTVPPERTVLDVVEEAGLFVLSSCREGTCGTCETVVVEGDVDHRDSILSPEEQRANDRMMICVSRAACPRLVLEL
ncbi:PDR/VanB family oxidoreductase [Agromyces albus]|uniref:Oxidoreductase n=1 Tax=Agromyces albus TaxID=205332 RepID=A0A4Q2L6T9_9MICO|nr:PDR/VanB family oxidoreductase [Agromyces albus]RXZ73317.1 oxidoreductase [Agromyces albus]